MASLYQARRDNPFHISVGAVVVNGEGKILVHKREKHAAPLPFQSEFLDRNEIYILARETVEDDESLEQAVLRGVAEEFGVAGRVEKYLGARSLVITTGNPAWEWEKTTLYFQVTPIGEAERVIDDESFSVLEWHDPDFLIERMRGQGGKDRSDLDESKIIETYAKYA